MRGLQKLEVMEVTRKTLNITSYEDFSFQGRKANVKVLLHTLTPFTHSYTNTAKDVQFYVPDEALNAFKSAWDSRIIVKPLSEYTGKIYG